MRAGAWLVLGSIGLSAVAATFAVAQNPPQSTATRPPAVGADGALAVDWAAARRAQQTPVAARGARLNAKLVAGAQAQIDRVPVPVLLPGDPGLAADLRFFAAGDHYTVSSRDGGLAFSLAGAGRALRLPSAAAKALPGGSLSARVPADGIVIEQTESGLDASFTRFGAAYSISLECADGANDPRCGDPAYVRGVISRLTVVVPAQGGA